MECYGQPRTRESVKRAIEFFQKATETDPHYARAYGKLGASYTLLAINTRGDYDARARAMASAQEYAQKGVSLDGSDADALLALGYVLLWNGSFAEGEHVIERAYALNPHNVDIAMSYVTALSHIGEAERAIRLAEAVIQRNPRRADSDLFDLAFAHFFAGHDDDAVALFDRLPEVFSNREVYAAAYANAGRIDQARRHASSCVEELRATWVGKPATDVSELLRWEFKYNFL
jgi:tetratricopeptide (TPR) repeat protein